MYCLATHNSGLPAETKLTAGTENKRYGWQSTRTWESDGSKLSARPTPAASPHAAHRSSLFLSGLLPLLQDYSDNICGIQLLVVGDIVGREDVSINSWSYYHLVPITGAFDLLHGLSIPCEIPVLQYRLPTPLTHTQYSPKPIRSPMPRPIAGTTIHAADYSYTTYPSTPPSCSCLRSLYRIYNK